MTDNLLIGWDEIFKVLGTNMIRGGRDAYEYEDGEQWRNRKAEKFLSKGLPVWYLPEFDDKPRIELSALVAWMKNHESKTYIEWLNMPK